MAVTAIIPAAGYGKRMQSAVNKQFMLLQGKPVLVHTLELFAAEKFIDEIIIVVREDEIDFCKATIAQYSIPKIKAVIAGGKERQHSVWNGLQCVSSESDLVVVHDGARPLLFPEVLHNAIIEAYKTGAIVVGVPVKDTIKVVDEQNIITSTPERRTLWSVQTPQMFSKDLLIAAFKHAWDKDILATDDAALVEALGKKVTMSLGSYENIKITTPEDLVLAEAFLARRMQK